MKYCNISCFTGFHCLAGACPDTCCSGWEIDLDRETLARYRSLPGPLGDRIREKLRTEDGYTFFALEESRCPFLNGENLCELILQLGDEALSVTCREHPRFVEEYGSLQETCLSISCPEAARLLLEGPVELVIRETAEEAEEDWELDENLLQLLLSCRQEMFAMLAADRPLAERAALLLDCARAFQALLTPRDDVIGTSVYRETAGNEYDGCFAPPLTLDLPGFLGAMAQMEFTSPRLPALLARCTASDTLFNMYPNYGGRLLAYFLYRYVLRAVWDGDVYSKIRFSVYSAAAILALSRELEDPDPICAAAILYSREVEHSDENLDLLYAYLREQA